MYLDKTVFIERLAPGASNADQEGFATHPGFVGGVKMNIQPASPQLTALAEGEMFKTFQAFTTTSGVIENMRITVSGSGEVYTVRGREIYDAPVGKHYELILFKAGV